MLVFSNIISVNINLVYEYIKFTLSYVCYALMKNWSGNLVVVTL